MRNQSPWSRLTSATFREWLQTAAILFGALAATYQFYFKEVLSPAKEPTALDVSVKLEKIGERNGTLFVKAIVSAKNPTHRRIYVPAFWFTAYGAKFGNGKALSAEEFVARLDGIGDALINRHKPDLAFEVFAQRRIVLDTVAWWDPSDKTNDEAVLAIPKGRYDYVELRVLYLHSRDGDALGTAEWTVGNDGAWVAQFRLKAPDGNPTLLDSTNKDQVDWAEQTGTGYNWYVTALAI